MLVIIFVRVRRRFTFTLVHVQLLFNRNVFQRSHFIMILISTVLFILFLAFGVIALWNEWVEVWLGFSTRKYPQKQGSENSTRCDQQFSSMSFDFSIRHWVKKDLFFLSRCVFSTSHVFWVRFGQAGPGNDSPCGRFFPSGLSGIRGEGAF